MSASLTVSKAPVVAARKASLLSDLQSAKANALQAMTYQGYRVTLSTQDQLDVQVQLSIIEAQPSGATLAWEIIDNVFLTWTAPDLQALQSAGIEHIQSVYANAKAIVAQIDAAQTLADIAKIDVSQGWPA